MTAAAAKDPTNGNPSMKKRAYVVCPYALGIFKTLLMLFWTLILEAGSDPAGISYFTPHRIHAQPIKSHLTLKRAARVVSRAASPCRYGTTLTVMVFVTVKAFDVPVAATVPVTVTV